MSNKAERPPQLPTGYYVICPHCEDELRLHHKYAGLTTACRKCGGNFCFDMTRAGAKLAALFVHCPHCTAELRAIPYFRGKNVACNQCDGTFTLASRRLCFFASLVYRDEHHPENATPSAESDRPNQSPDEPANVEAPQAAEEETITADNQQPETNSPENKPAETQKSDSAIGDLFDDNGSLFDDENCLFDDNLNPDDAIILGESSDLIAKNNFERLIEEETGDWYCEVLGQTLGPMPLDELKELARSKQIERGDRVRCGDKGEWVSPLTVASLLPDVDLESLPTDRPTSASRESVTRSHRNNVQNDPQVPLGPSTHQASMPLYDRSSDSTGDAACAVAEEETGVRAASTATLDRESSPDSASPVAQIRTSSGSTLRTDPASRKKKNRLPSVSKPAAKKKKTAWETPKSAPRISGRSGMIAAGVASVMTLAFGVWYFGFGSSSLNSHLRTLESMAEDFQQLREEKPSRAEWAKYHRQAMLKLKPIVSDLSASDGANDPARQSLLRAAREHLPGMYIDSRYGTNKSEKAFFKDLDEAKASLAGGARAKE